MKDVSVGIDQGEGQKSGFGSKRTLVTWKQMGEK